jgi:MFS family permease
MSDGHAPQAQPRLLRVGRALRHRNYRLFFAGQSLSLIGTWLTRVATAWLVYRLTHSAWLLGLVGFVSQVPTFVLAPIAGVWIDRISRYRALLVSQVFAMLQSALLAWFALRGTITITHVLVLSAMQGVINAIDMPARQALVADLIEDRADLPNAIALNSTMFNSARLIGPAIAGALIAWTGEGWCFALDAASYLFVIASLLAMRPPAAKLRRERRALMVELLEGWRYVTGFAPIRSILGLLMLVSLLGVPYVVLMPAVASEVLGGDSHTLGFLTAANGLGALLGALHLASRTSVLGLGKMIAWCAAIFGVSLMLLSASRSLWLSMTLLGVSGAAMMLQMGASNTLLQTIVDEDKRGRVMSFYSMAFFGTMPIGSLMAGVLAERIGVPGTIFVGGIPCILGGLFFLRELPRLREYLRPIYRRLGILPQPSELPAPIGGQT